MRAAEVGALLNTIKTFQSYQEIGEAAELVWHKALTPAMGVGWAIDFVAAYYGKEQMSDSQILPSDLNKGWKKRLADEQEENLASRQRDTVTKDAPVTGMPDWFAAAMQEAYGHTDFGNDAPAPGSAKRSAKDVHVIFEKHALTAGINLAQIMPKHEDASDSHCRTAGCTCTHSGGCYKGWVDANGKSGPCRICRPQMHHDLQNGKVTTHYGN